MAVLSLRVREEREVREEMEVRVHLLYGRQEAVAEAWEVMVRLHQRAVQETEEQDRPIPSAGL